MFDSLTRRRKLLLASLGAVVGLGLLSLYLFADPSSGLYPRCSFRMLTGLSCPGCGTQRAFHALLHGDLRAAAGFNAILLVELPLLLLLFLSPLLAPRFPRLWRALSSRGFILSVLVLIIGWTIVRNIFDI